LECVDLRGSREKRLNQRVDGRDAHLRLTPASVTRTLVVTTAGIVARDPQEKVGTFPDPFSRHFRREISTHSKQSEIIKCNGKLAYCYLC